MSFFYFFVFLPRGFGVFFTHRTRAAKKKSLIAFSSMNWRCCSDWQSPTYPIFWSTMSQQSSPNPGVMSMQVCAQYAKLKLSMTIRGKAWKLIGCNVVSGKRVLPRPPPTSGRDSSSMATSSPDSSSDPLPPLSPLSTERPPTARRRAAQNARLSFVHVSTPKQSKATYIYKSWRTHHSWRKTKTHTIKCAML